MTHSNGSNGYPELASFKQLENFYDLKVQYCIANEFVQFRSVEELKTRQEKLTKILSELNDELIRNTVAAKLRFIVSRPEPDGSMLVIASFPRDEDKELEHKRFMFYSRFRWQRSEETVEVIRGISGYCASTNETVLIPDLENKPNRYKDYWIEPGYRGERGGILDIPIVDNTGTTCLAVLSILASKRNFLNEERQKEIEFGHIDKLRKFLLPHSNGNSNGHEVYTKNGSSDAAAEKMIERLPPDPSAKEPVSDLKVQWYLDGLLEAWDGLSEEKQAEVAEKVVRSPLGEAFRNMLKLEPVNSVAHTIDIEDTWLDPNEVAGDFARVIKASSTRRTPVRMQRIWRAFRNRENDIVAEDEIAKQFEDTKNPDNDARLAITWVNRAFEKFGIDLEITHVPAYRLKRRSA